MGVYVLFFHGAPDGLPSHFLGGPLAAFRSWYAEAERECPGEVNPRCAALLEEVLTHGQDALTRASSATPGLVDALLTDYYGLFADARQNLMEDAARGMLRLRRYEALEVRVRQRGLSPAVDLLAFISTGRPILRDPAQFPFQPEDDDPYRLSFWTAEEVEALRAVLQPLSEQERHALDPDRGALPTLQEALAVASARQSGLIITVA